MDINNIFSLTESDIGQSITLWPLPGETVIITLVAYRVPIRGGTVLSPDERGMRYAASDEVRTFGLTDSGHVIGLKVEERWDGRKSQLKVIGRLADLEHAERALGWEAEIAEKEEIK